MSQLQTSMAWCLLVGFIAGTFLILIGNSIYYRSASMEYGDGQVLMLLLDTYPDLTFDARDYLIECLYDGHISQCEYDTILRKAARAVFYDRGDVSMGEHLVRDPC
jgi:hypothetical protein